MNTLAQMISSAFPGGQPCLCSPDEGPVSRLARRRKLWELPHAHHCALIGTCLPVPEMRRLAPHSGYDVSKMADYSLHTVVVGYCKDRSALTEAIQRYFDKRHAHALARFTPATDAAAIAFLWREALAHGDDIPGALWAAWTHPAMNEELGREIHGDIHMLSHQVGTAVRADLRQLEHYKDEALRLRNEAEALRRSQNAARQANETVVTALRRSVAAAERRAARLEGRDSELAAAAHTRTLYIEEQQRAAALAARVELLEQRNEAARQRAVRLEQELQQARAELTASAQARAAVPEAGNIDNTGNCGVNCPAEAPLSGRCVLCVGGRSGLVDGYRKMVEQRGGRFLHHDGGQEEHLHRIDAAIANADAVVCQTGCISHAAYWRLKEACKKQGKTCVFVPSPGVGSFARSLAALVDAPAGQTIRLSAGA